MQIFLLLHLFKKLFMGKSLLFTGLLFLALNGYSQDPRLSDWHRIDSNINKKNNFLSTYELIQQLKQEALAEKKYFRLARCYYYQLLITDQRTEDSLYFRNSVFIDSILKNPGNKPELELAMHLLQAKRLSGFTTRNLRFNRQRYERKDIPVNYAAYTNSEIDSMAAVHFESAKQLEKKIVITGMDEVLWMSSDPLLFLFKPGLFDIIIAEQISISKKNYRYLPAGRMNQLKLLSLSQDGFISEISSVYKENISSNGPLKYYKEWLSHRQANPAAYYFIESLARKFLYEAVTKNANETPYQEIYENYLARLLLSPYNTVKGYAVYQLCLLWNQQSKKYFPSKGYDYRTEMYRDQNDFDTTYRYQAAKALKLFEQNKAILDSFGYLKNILLQMEQQIRETDFNMTVQRYNLPGEPMLAELKFKNVQKLFYSVTRINNDFSLKYKTRKEFIRILKQLPEVSNQSIDLPATNDYNEHAIYVKIDGLSPGNYALLFSAHPLSDSNRRIEQVQFNVTSIAVQAQDKRVFVLDRKTGLPLTGATVKGSYLHDPKDTFNLKPPVTKNYTVNEQGLVVINDYRIRELEVYYKNDTAYSPVNPVDDNDDEPEDAYDKDEYDDLVDFYEENATAEIFTDRSIYRPGQTVYFKAIFMTKNRKTGEAMVMSKKNMKGSFFKNVYKKWLKESEPFLYLNNPFGEETDSLKISLNDYGSVSGSFKIPKTAATGEWSIEPDDVDVARNEGSFRVEEYKRPSYEISIEEPKKELVPGDPFTVKVKVKSFAGASLNNVLINYSIDRNGVLPVYDTLLDKTVERDQTEFLEDTSAYTNADGELEIQVNDPLLKNYSLSNGRVWNFTYSIDAEAIDITGENYEAESSVRISSRPINIRLSLNDKYDRGEKNNTIISTTDLHAGKVSKDVNVKISRIVKDERLFTERKLMIADQWLYGRSQWQEWFPLVDFDNREDSGTKKLVMERMINTGKDGKLALEPDLFPAGNYEIEASYEENGELRGYTKRTFSVFDEKENKLPQRTWSFYHLPFNSFLPGDTVKYLSGNSEAPVYSIYSVKYYAGKKKTHVSYYYEMTKQDKGIYKWKWKVPADATDQVAVSQFYILNNQLFTNTERIYINNNLVVEPEIIVEQYRQKLSPGSKETFSVSVKTKNENTAAELMTTLYDASLDKLEKHEWRKPEKERRSYLGFDRAAPINSTANSNEYSFSEYYYTEGQVIRPARDALWWLNPSDYSNEDVMADWSRIPARFTTSLEGRVRGLNMQGELASTQGLSEVIVTAYGTVQKRSLLSASVSGITIRGAASLSSYAQPLIILDGVPYEGDLGKIDPNTITQGIVLKGADASAIYGARAANGVLVLSTKGDIVFPTAPPEPPLPPRKNFNETAFFFPAIHADKDGYYKFTFTMPESVTEWNWKMMAHTKDLHFAYAERKLNTQLPLMVQPNMPRLLYQGDRIVLQSRISNLDTTDANGKAICKIEDAVTGEDITALFVTKMQNDFLVAKKANTSSAFEIKVPRSQMNPVRITVSVRSQNFADGEEHLIPILSPKILVRESFPFRFSKGMDTIVQGITLPADAELYGIGISITPKPQSALINALPYLAHYSFDCAEQTFNKLRAYLTAFKIMRTDKEAQQSFEKAKAIVEKLPEQKEQLPDELSEQAMPWLNLANKTTRQQKQLFELLDTSQTTTWIDKHLARLFKLQNGDGGLTWFEGGKSNSYISQYVLAGFGKLKKDSLLIPKNIFGKKYDDFIERLIVYCDKEFMEYDAGTLSFVDPLFFGYARSYWINDHPFTDSLHRKMKDVLDESWKRTSNRNLYRQSMLVTVSPRYFGKETDEHKKAIQQLNSIEQLAIRDDNGTRWKELADADDISNSSEETLAVLAEAFSEADLDAELFPGIIKWLLTSKSEDQWSSTKATSAVVGMLYKEKGTATGTTQTISGTVNNNKLSVTDDLLSGSSYSFIKESKTTPVELRKENNVSASGNITWYYFSAGDNSSSVNKDVSLKKELFIYNSAGSKWELIDQNRSLKIADKIKVVLTVETSKALRYVYIDDKRAAAFEPAETNSGYRYMPGISYYLSVRDAGMQFFTEFIPSGRSVISYEMTVAQEGNFSNGPAQLQCMYKPEVNASSNSIVVKTVQ